MEDVGREVRRLREERGWSQAKLAAGADMAVSGISQIETGVRSPSAATLRKLARAFGVEVADLFPKAQAPLQLDLEERGGASERYYTAYEALGRTLAFGWNDDLKKWDDKIPEGTSPDLFDFGRLLQWALEVAGTRRVYQVLAEDSGDPQREQLADTLGLMERAEQEALDKVKRAFEPAKTFDEFRKIWEANDMDAVLSNAESR